MRRWLVVLVLAPWASVLAGCSGVEVTRGPACGETADEQRQCLREAGFDSITGLSIVAVHKREGVDTSIVFTLRGQPAAVDRALVAADFSATTTPGTDGVQPSDAVDLTDLRSPRSAKDVWIDEYDVPIQRGILRGQLVAQPDQELLVVNAFTT